MRALPSSRGTTRSSPLLRYGVAVGASTLALLFSLLLRPLVEPNPFLLFFAAVAISAWYGGLGAGLLTTGLSLFFSDYFLIPPYGTLTLDLAEGLRLATFVLVATIISSLSEARRWAELRLAVTLSSIGDAVITTDAQGQVTFMNAVAESLTGWKQDHVQKRHLDTIFQIVNADTRQTVESPVTKVLRDGTVAGLANHTLLIAQDGSARPIDDSGAPIYNDAGTIRGVVLVFRDITERYQAEQALRESEARFRTVADTAPVMIWMSDAAGDYTFFNQPWLTFTGHTMEHECGNGWIAGVHPDDIERCLAIAGTAVTTHQPFTREYRLCRADGVYRWMTDSAVPRTAADGAFAGYIGSCIDITERVKAEAAQRFLASASNLLASSLDYATTLAQVAHLAVPHMADWCAVDIVQPDATIARLAVAHVDPAKVQWANELQQRFPPNPAARQGVPQVIRTGSTEFYPEITDALLEAAIRTPEELDITRRIGFRSVVIAPLMTRGRTLGALTFVTAESARTYTQADVELAEELARRAASAVDNARLFAAEQVARTQAETAVSVRDQFLSVAAHELRTPLTSLLGNAQLMQRRAARNGTLTEREHHTLNVINDQALRLNRMILTLLDISKLEAGQLHIEMAPMDLCALIRRLIDEMRPMLRERRLDLICPDASLMVNGDELRLEQVFQNLCQNALRYSADTSIIRIEIAQEHSQACVRVIDHGLGIPATALPQLFQRFYRAPNVEARQINGMGIGLYIVHEIVRLHGGEVKVESVEGVGSTFTVCLPLRNDAAAA